MNGAVACVNGDFLPLADARIPVLDRGFLFSDGIYEVVAAYGGRPFARAAHLARLARSLQAIEIPDPLDAARWVALTDRLLAENASLGADLTVYLQVTRGAPSQRRHACPADTTPTVVGLCQRLLLPTDDTRSTGVAVLSLPDQRWARCDIKSVSLLPNLLATQQAEAAGCNEALLHRGGLVTEGASSNVWAVLDGRIITPPEGPGLLSGITRDVLLAALRDRGTDVEERELSLESLRTAEEIWLTSTTREVLPVTTLDGRAVGAGRPGPQWQRADQCFQDAKRQAA